jgi:hypothetical protein
MEVLKNPQADTRTQESHAPQGGHSLQLEGLPGVWSNTNRGSRGIVKVAITVRESRLWVRTFGAGELEASDWGEVEAEHVYASSMSSRAGAGFVAQYSFDFSQVHLQANWNQGLLVLASFTRFKDGSKRSDYFSREFFHRQRPE